MRSFALVEPEVGRARQEPSGGAFGWIALVLGALAVALVVAARRRARRTGRPVGVRDLPGGTAVGNALFDLGSILQPDRPDAAVIRRVDEEPHEDARGDGREP
jgi:hypothetical protein